MSQSEQTGGTVESYDHHHEWAVICLGCDARPNVADHYAIFDEDGWQVEHSLACRMAGKMASCPEGTAIRMVADEPDPDLFGRHRITNVDSEGLPSLERDTLYEPPQSARGAAEP